MSLSLSLAKAIHDGTDNRLFLSRVYDSIKAVAERDGVVSGGLVVGAMTAAQISALALSYFCMEGVVRSFIEVNEDTRPVVRLRPLGDVGGWTSLTVFSGLLSKKLLDKLVGEGESIRLMAVCQKWIQDNKSAIERNPKFHKKLYSEINDILKEFNSRCLFGKSLASLRITALEICTASGLNDRGIDLSKDRKLEKIFRAIQLEQGQETSFKSNLKCLKREWKQVRQRGCSDQSTALIFGVVLPFILLTNVMFSIIGEIGLGKELFVDREELTDTGHFGEWPINAFEGFVMALLLALWYIINKGDVEITKEIYASQIEELKADVSLHNRLCDIGNEELCKKTSNSSSSQLAIEYKFEKL